MSSQMGIAYAFRLLGPARDVEGESPWGVLTFGLGSLSQHGNILWFRHN